jgi:DUF4097 and DUF4098 domain-containing protein YvlB
MRPQKIFFLLLILLAGAATETTWRLRNHLGFVPLGWRVFRGQFYGPSFSFEDKTAVAVPAGAVVSVENAFGAVRVTRGEPGQVRVAIKKVVFVPTEAAARALAGRVEIRAHSDGDRVEIGTNRADLERSGALADAGLETHLDVVVPPSTSVEVRNEHGLIDVADVARAAVDGAFEPVRVERVSGDVSVKGHHADITVASVGGALTLSARHGDAGITDVTGLSTVDVEHGAVRIDKVGGLSLALKHGDLEAKAVRGDLEFKGEHSAVHVSDVSGRAGVRTTFDDVHLEKVTGDAYVKTEHGAVETNDVGGALRVEATYAAVAFSKVGGHADVSVEHGGVRGSDLRAGAAVRVSGDQVDLTDFRGPVRVDVKNGGAHLVPGTDLSAPLSVTTEHGTITLDLTRGSRFDLRAAAHPGNVAVSFGGFEASESGESKIVGHSGSGGSAVTLEAQHGDVRVGSDEKRASNEE